MTVTIDGTSGITYPAGTIQGTGYGPAFSAYQSSIQSLTAGVTTKIQFQTEEFDTANCFDNVTNYRFTPNVAGYYQVSGAFQVNGSAVILPILYKNGVNFRYGIYQGAGTVSPINNISLVIYMNGTTDYIELYGNSNATLNTTSGALSTFFAATFVRGA